MKQSNTKRSTIIDLSIVIPALREERRIGKSLDELAIFIKKDKTLKDLSVEVLVVVADGGDKTAAVVRSKQKKFKNLKILKPGKPLGKGRDVQYGMLRAKGAAALFMDADLATPLKHIPRFYKAFSKGAEVVIGTRNLHKHHPRFGRRLISNVGNLMFRIVGGVWVEDSQCGFKLFSAKAAKICFSKLTIMGWGFDMEVLTIVRINKLSIKKYRINDWRSVPEGTFDVGMIQNIGKTLVEMLHILKNRVTGDYKDESTTATSRRAHFRKAARNIFIFAVIPILVYLVIFYIYQPHYFGQFFKAFYLDGGDGLQNVWNIWWVNKSIVHEGVSPYFTTMLHWPHGTTLLPQTMNIYNGLVAIPLMNVLNFSLVAATNFAVLTGFIGGGVTMFWFIWKLYRKYLVALIAGGLFTFSAYHFAHAQGHLQLVSLEFIPLFLLAFWSLIERPRYRYAAFAAGSLFLVMLCDYYYVLWCMMLGALWLGWNIYTKELRLTKQTLKVLMTFGVLSALLVGPLLISLTLLNKHDPLQGSHDPYAFSLDPLAVFIPGGSWVFRSLTSWHWTKLAYLSEMSVYFGFATLIALAVTFYRSVIRRRLYKTPRWLNFWWIILFGFGVLALGPRLTTFGRHLDGVPLPYAFMEHLLPTLRISGMPVRWVLIALIAAIVLVSYLLSTINTATRWGKIIIAIFVLVSVVELWPARLPLTPTATRRYVYELQTLPDGAIIDNGALSGAEQLYNQTVHDKPMAFGYVTRMPQSVSDKSFHVFADLEQGRLDNICRVHKIRYITVPYQRPLNTQFPVIYNDKETLIYDFKNSDNC